MRERKYTASRLQSLPLKKVSLWEPGTLEATKAPIPIEGELITRNEGKILRDRLQRRGVSTLSNTELLSVALTGKGKDDAVQQVDTLFKMYSLHELLHADFGEIAQGLGETKAAQLQSILEVARRLTLPSEERVQIISPRSAAELLSPEMEHLPHEEMRVLLLDMKNGVMANLLLYQGTVNSSVVRNAEVFQAAVSRKAAGIVLAHNHPSGLPEPSPEDISTTRGIVVAGQTLDIPLIDHIIIGKNGNFVSLKERLMW